MKDFSTPTEFTFHQLHTSLGQQVLEFVDRVIVSPWHELYHFIAPLIILTALIDLNY